MLTVRSSVNTFSTPKGDSFRIWHNLGDESPVTNLGGIQVALVMRKVVLGQVLRVLQFLVIILSLLHIHSSQTLLSWQLRAALNNALKTHVFSFLVSHHTPTCEEAPFLLLHSIYKNNRYQSHTV